MNIKEVVPKSGMLFQEISLYPVLCKPKLMPLKSVTLDKLERMQKEAQEKVIEMEKQVEEEKQNLENEQQIGGQSDTNVLDSSDGPSKNVDVWRPEDEPDDQHDSNAM